MSYDRPHEDRLGTDGSSASQVLTRTGTGTAKWEPGGFTPVVVYAECNSPINTGGTPNAFTDQPFDTFYDKDYANLSGVLPAGLGLTYAAGVFTATADGLYALNFGADLTAAPGSTGRIQLNTPNYGYRPSIFVAASGNDPSGTVGITVAVRSGDTFHIEQYSPGTSIDLIAGYAALDIIRIAGSIS